MSCSLDPYIWLLNIPLFDPSILLALNSVNNSVKSLKFSRNRPCRNDSKKLSADTWNLTRPSRHFTKSGSFPADTLTSWHVDKAASKNTGNPEKKHWNITGYLNWGFCIGQLETKITSLVVATLKNCCHLLERLWKSLQIIPIPKFFSHSSFRMSGLLGWHSNCGKDTAVFGGPNHRVDGCEILHQLIGG